MVKSLKEPNTKLVRWCLKLEESEYEIVHKRGKLNRNVDALSRIEIQKKLKISLDISKNLIKN